MSTYSRPIRGLGEVRSAVQRDAVEDFAAQLEASGYVRKGVRRTALATVHLLVWSQDKAVDVRQLDEASLERFIDHLERCHCPGRSTWDRSPASILPKVRNFLRYLRRRGLVTTKPPFKRLPILVEGFVSWMREDRGVTPWTLADYGSLSRQLVEALGEEPEHYTAHAIREFARQRCRDLSRDRAKGIFTALRMFLRYLVQSGRCPDGLQHALPSTNCWSARSLPRSLSNEQIQRVLDLIPLSTPAGIREKAILLLLARLGFRAREVARLRLDDLDWKAGTVQIQGKNDKEVLLPLPQDVGEALLDYLRDVRPRTACDSFFLTLRAPHRLILRKFGGTPVSLVARQALERAGIHRPRMGAQIFRHSTAASLLRAGVGLENIRGVLRHESVRTTAIYAKVAPSLLELVVQPWPEVA